MAISEKNAQEHLNDYAVTCCRVESGTVIKAEHLEDPALFPDFEDSGLLKISPDCYKIGQVLGAKCIKTIDALASMTPQNVEGKIQEAKDALHGEKPSPETATSQPGHGLGQSVRIHIGEGKDIALDIPLTLVSSGILPTVTAQPQAPAQTAPAAQNEKLVRSLKRRYFKIASVKFGEETALEGRTLIIRNSQEICEEAAAAEKLVLSMKLEIITPEQYGAYSDTIMDVLPLATKEEGELGHGITRVLDGIVFVLTGTDENGVQIGEFGSSEGELERNIMWGRPGAPDKGDIILKAQVTISAGANMERPGPFAAHKAFDYVMEEIRQALKKADSSLCTNEEELAQIRRPGKPKLVLVKEIMGQGAMHDNLILPVEPAGMLGGKPNVDLGNLPIFFSPLEVLDGGIRALTCIGPASKETTRHYFREPLVLEAMKDTELDLAGVIFVGSPQVNNEKFYVSKRLGMTVEGMDADGAIVTTEGFGNNHIDFASHIEQIGERGIKVVGMTYSAVQGALVVGNKYMSAMVDLNKSKQGIENEILSNNTLTQDDALRAIAMLKACLAGENIAAANRKWGAEIKQANIAAIEKTTGENIPRADNEQALPKSKKRLEVYEVEI